MEQQQTVVVDQSKSGIIIDKKTGEETGVNIDGNKMTRKEGEQLLVFGKWVCMFFICLAVSGYIFEWWGLFLTLILGIPPALGLKKLMAHAKAVGIGVGDAI